MKKRIRRLLGWLICAAALLGLVPASGAAAQTAPITDFNTLMSAVRNAREGDTLLVGDIDFSPLSPDVPNSTMVITLDKSLTIKSAKAEGTALFRNGGFVLSGSKLSGEKITVRFENILFDGKADYENLTEADYAYPWSEAEQTYTYYASLQAQQALAFMGNVDASFSGCVFQNYMHEYGPVIDIRYADYTGNEYINLPDYSGCSLKLDFENCSIVRNSALYDGGAIYIEANNNVVLNLKNCHLRENRSANGDFSRGGGAIYAEGAALHFVSCTLEQNTANHVFADTLLPEYDTHRGGAVLLQSATLTMKNTLLSENSASMGGAICATNSAVDLDGCRLTGNRAQAWAANPEGMVGPWSNMSQGGAMYVEGNSNDTVTLVNCQVVDNFAQNAYGGIYGYYVPFEDPSLPTYNIRLLLCTYTGNRDGVDYDYATVGDLAWLSHPGDMFANPHMTLFGCYVTDETFAGDFPRSETPTAGNGYNYLCAQESESLRRFEIPAGEAQAAIGSRYDGKLTQFSIGNNDTSFLYHEESTAQAIGPLVWGGAVGLLLLGSAGVYLLLRSRKATAAEPGNTPAAPEETPAEAEKQTVIKTRYSATEIDRILERIPETGTLTARELEVLREVLSGRKQSEIAYRLGIGVTTVKDFNRKIYTKLNVENKTALFAQADGALRE